MQADVLDARQVQAARDELIRAWDRVDILVNAAGGNLTRARNDDRSIFEVPLDAFDEVLRLNLHGTVIPSLAFGEAMARQGSGSIINISSMAAYSPQQSMNAYSTSKAAVFMFGDCLRAELDQAGVGLTTVCPGVINTNIVRTTRFDVPAGQRGDHEHLLEHPLIV